MLFAKFCTVTDVSFRNPTYRYICAYVADLAQSDVELSIVHQNLKDLRDLCVRNGCTTFASRLRWPILCRTFQGMKSADKSGSQKELPGTPELIVWVGTGSLASL